MKKEFIEKWHSYFSNSSDKIYKEFTKDLDNLINKWISIKDELPKDNERVLVYHKAVDDICQVKYKKGRWHRGDIMEYIGIKHWQPRPQPPKE